MKRALLAVTTANQLAYTKLAIESLQHSMPEDFELVVFDDASSDDTLAYLRGRGVRHVTKEAARGLTDSWNLAYRMFRDDGFELLFLSNNDVLVPQGALESMARALETYEAVGPLTTETGSGFRPAQSVGRHQITEVDDTNPANVDRVQNALKAATRGVLQVDALSGFFMAFNRQITRYERPDGNLFDPARVNVGNEDELCLRINGPKGVCLDAFVFHFKGVSFQAYESCGGLVVDRELTWEQASRLSLVGRLRHLKAGMLLPRLIGRIKGIFRP